MKKVLFALFACALVVTGCASSGADDSQKKIDDLEAEVDALKSDESTTTRESVVSTDPPVATTTAPPTTTQPPTTAPPTTAAPAALMPDVVCMNLQDAQDHIQSETGVFLSLSEDASGAGRSQMIDSNWIVVAQRPSPGTPIGEGDAVLSAVKLDEPNPC